MNSEHSAAPKQTYRARWILPVSGEPIENGTIEISDGRITALHNHHDPRAVDLGNVAIIPGLVNAHTHLEFSELTAPLEPADPFTDWIRSVVAHRQTRTTGADESIKRGRRESALFGTTLLAEISTDDNALAACLEFGPAVCVLHETIGFRPERISEQIASARAFLDDAKRDQNGDLVRGLSPHAPYSVHPELYHRLVELAAEKQALVAVHLAETRAELEFLEKGTGPFTELLQEFGVWQADVISPGSRPLDYLRPLETLDAALIVHGNYLADEEIDFLAGRPQLTVVYCPRTHAYFGHDPHPWLELLERGGSLAIGTDSRASNPDLSIWRELCFLRRQFPRVEPCTLLQLGTLNGARALGRSAEEGQLATGSAANLTLVALVSSASSDPYTRLFNEGNRVTSTMRNGRWFE